MSEPLRMRCTTMLNQARAFAEHDPHDALGRVDEVLREIDACLAEDPSDALDLRPVRARAETLRGLCAQAYERFQADAARRALAYTARIQRENSGPGHV